MHSCGSIYLGVPEHCADIGGRSAAGAQLGEGSVAGALGELLALGVGQQPVMVVDRLGKADEHLKQAMQIGGGKVAYLDPVLAKNSVQDYERSWDFWKSRLPPLTAR